MDMGMGMGMGVGMGVGVEVGCHPRPPQERFYHPTCIKSICHIATLCRSTDELLGVVVCARDDGIFFP